MAREARIVALFAALPFALLAFFLLSGCVHRKAKPVCYDWRSHNPVPCPRRSWSYVSGVDVPGCKR